MMALRAALKDRAKKKLERDMGPQLQAALHVIVMSLIAGDR
jgi:hypothetical protein